MEYVRLGSAGLKVSRICLGCMSFGSGFDWMLPRLKDAKLIGSDTFKNDDASIASQITRYKESAASGGAPAVMIVCSYVPGAATAIRQIRAADRKSVV